MLKGLAVSLKFRDKILNMTYKLIKCLTTLKEFYAGCQEKTMLYKPIFYFKEAI